MGHLSVKINSQRLQIVRKSDDFLLFEAGLRERGKIALLKRTLRAHRAKEVLRMVLDATGPRRARIVA